MKINVKDTKALATALAAYPGGMYKATAEDLQSAAEEAEARLALLPASKRPGARLLVLSGGPKKPNAYKSKRRATRAMLRRYPTGWFVEIIKELDLWPNECGGCRLRLDEAQREALQAAHETQLLNF